MTRGTKPQPMIPGSVGYLKLLQVAYSYTPVEARICSHTRYIPSIDTRQVIFLHLAMQP